MMQPISISQFSLSYHSQSICIHPIDLIIKPGDRIGIVGESGAGKSSFVKSIFNNLLEYSQISGTIATDQEILLRNGKWNQSLMKKWWGKNVAFVAQEPMITLSPDYTIQQQLEDVLFLQKIPREKIEEHSKRFFSMSAFPFSRKNSFPRYLSGGENQRACMSLAMSIQPKILVADEPTTGLDLIVEKQVIQTMQKILTENSFMSLLMVTHSLGVLNQILHKKGKILVFYEGHIVERLEMRPNQPLALLLDSVQHPYTKKLFEDYLQATPANSKHSVSLYTKKIPEEKFQQKNILLFANNISTGYEDKTILENFSYSLYQNQNLAIVGETGSGKTSLAKALSGLLSWNQWRKGELLRYDPSVSEETNFSYNMDTIPSPQISRHFNLNQLVWQNPSEVFSPSETIHEVLLDACQVWGKIWQIRESRKEQEQRIRKILNDLSLPNTELESFPQNLSGGQRKRLLLARSFLAGGYGSQQNSSHQRIFYIDEPLRGIDVINKKSVMQFIKTASQQCHATLVMITHDLQLAQYFCQDMVVMYKGNVVEIVPVAEIMDEYLRPIQHTCHPYTYDLITSIPRIDSFWEEENEPNISMLFTQEEQTKKGCCYLENCKIYQKLRHSCPTIAQACRIQQPQLLPISAQTHWQIACHAKQNYSSQLCNSII